MSGMRDLSHPSRYRPYDGNVAGAISVEGPVASRDCGIIREDLKLVAQRADELSHHAHNSMHHQMQLLRDHHQQVMLRQQQKRQDGFSMPRIVQYQPRNTSDVLSPAKGQQPRQVIDAGYPDPQPQSVPPSHSIQLTEYDLKSKDSKYRRWSPHMDAYLIQLLSDVVHSHPRANASQMTKKDWLYVCGCLRLINPETVYSTYTKYSCQQHLLHVVHNRYKVWHELMLQSEMVDGKNDYSFRWSAQHGKFLVFISNTNTLVTHELLIKELLYSDALALPDFESHGKSAMIMIDLFLTDAHSYMSLYHNEILPMLIATEAKYRDSSADLLRKVPRFDYPEAHMPFCKPLKAVSSFRKKKSKAHVRKSELILISDSEITSVYGSGEDSKGAEPGSGDCGDEKPDPDFTRTASIPVCITDENITCGILNDESNRDPLSRPELSSDTNDAPKAAAVTPIASPVVVEGNDTSAIYAGDTLWFSRLLHLHACGLVNSEEVLLVSEGVRDKKIPLFMLNILDCSYLQLELGEEDRPYSTNALDETVAERIRQFMIPMIYRVESTRGKKL